MASATEKRGGWSAIATFLGYKAVKQIRERFNAAI
jgi:hypothetical protein